MILAGAGTEKSSHSSEGSAPDQTGKMSAKKIVLLTFTERATIEAKEKILNIMDQKGFGIVVAPFMDFATVYFEKFGPVKW
ncbi:MAG: hypothetical protein Ct9H300mP9_5220 [Candidatus Neomarinimicrobiota bacterium]|nr:MAG: hypothetical protein Ct9H300mP9_5220 [Candidatus Neomarinimicrobiota bacterium]